MVHTLPDLPYSYDALEPYICAEIMELHHGTHHKAYVTNLNAAQAKMKEAVAGNDVKKAIELQSAIKFNGGGHINHSLFWTNLTSKEFGGGNVPPGKLYDLILRDFGSVDELRKQLTAAALGIQGSGWTWLGYDVAARRLQVSTTANQDPLLLLVPIIAWDLWEHSFYIQYRTKKAEYLTNLWEVTDFLSAEKRLLAVM